MKSKRRWLLLLPVLALFAWAWQAASWRPKLIGAQAFSSPPTARQDSIGTSWPATQLLVSPDGRGVAAVAVLRAQDELSLFSLSSRRPLWRYSPVGARIWPLAFSPDGRLLAVAVDTRKTGLRHVLVYLLDAKSGRQLRPIWPGHYLNDLQSAAFLSNGELVISTRWSATLIDTQTGKAVRPWNFHLPELPPGKDPWLDQSHVAADGKTILVTTNGNNATAIAIYNTKTGERRGVWTVKGIFRNPRLSPDGTLWVMERDKANLSLVYDAATGQQLGVSFIGDTDNSPWSWSADSQNIVMPHLQNMVIADARTPPPHRRVLRRARHESAGP